MKIELDEVVDKIKNFDEVQFIILYGSASENLKFLQTSIEASSQDAAEERDTENSDVDLCIGYDGDEEEASRFRYDILSELFADKYDVQIFQLLPLYVKKEVLKGEVLYCRDKRELYDIAYQSVREFDDFKHRYYDYIGKEAIA